MIKFWIELIFSKSIASLFCFHLFIFYFEVPSNTTKIATDLLALLSIGSRGFGTSSLAEANSTYLSTRKQIDEHFIDKGTLFIVAVLSLGVHLL